MNTTHPSEAILPPVEGGFEAPAEAVPPTRSRPVPASPSQAAAAAPAPAGGETVKITPTRLREVAYQLELATKHQDKACELLSAMTRGKSGAVVENLAASGGKIVEGEFVESRGALLALADDLAAL